MQAKDSAQCYMMRGSKEDRWVQCPNRATHKVTGMDGTNRVPVVILCKECSQWILPAGAYQQFLMALPHTDFRLELLGQDELQDAQLPDKVRNVWERYIDYDTRHKEGIRSCDERRTVETSSGK